METLGGVPDEVADAVPSVWQLLGYLPITVGVIALINYYTVTSGMEFMEVVNTDGGLVTLFNPFVYTLNILFHSGGWSHFSGNMTLWIPFGILFTLLTSNRHILGLALATNFMTSIVAITIEGIGVGLSHVVLGVAAATLVRSTGMAFQNTSSEWLQYVIAGLLIPLGGCLLLVMILAGPRWIADFYHFLGFLFGGAIEAIYVLSGRESDEKEQDQRSVPRRIGR